MGTKFCQRQIFLVEEEVRKEVVDKGKEEGVADAISIDECIRNGWIMVKRVKDKKILQRKILTRNTSYYDKKEFAGIHLGEANSILLAKELGVMVLIDEEDARVVARALGLKTRGTLYVLKKSLERGIISKKEAIETLDDMLNEGFRLSAPLYSEFIRSLK